MLDIFWEELIPHLEDHPLPEDPAAQEELDAFLADLRILPPQSSIPRPVGSRRFRFRENPAGIEWCEVVFGRDDCALTFGCRGKTEQLRAGFGHFDHSVFQLTDEFPHPVAACAVWAGGEKLEIRSFICDGIYRDVWTVDFSDPAEPLKNRLVCSCYRPPKPRFFAAAEE